MMEGRKVLMKWMGECMEEETVVAVIGLGRWWKENKWRWMDRGVLVMLAGNVMERRCCSGYEDGGEGDGMVVGLWWCRVGLR